MALACPRPVLGVPLVGVVTRQDDIGNRGWDTSSGKVGRHRMRIGRPVESGGRGRERARPLDLRSVEVNPFAVVKGDRADDAAPPAIGGGKPTLFDGALRNDDLVAEGGHADRLDVDAELARPEARARAEVEAGARFRRSPCCGPRSPPPRTALSQCSIERNWYSYSTWGARAISPATKMLSVTTPWMSNARQPASQATPQKPAASPAPSSHSMLRIEPSDARTKSTSSVVPSERRARRTCPLASPSSACTETPSAEIHSVLALHLRGDRADHASERACEWRRGALGDGYLESELAADRSRLRADETCADDQHAPRSGGQVLLYTGRIIAGAQRAHAVERGLHRIRPLPRADSSCDQQPVVWDLLAICQVHQPVYAIQARGGYAKPPIRIDWTQARAAWCGLRAPSPSAPAWRGEGDHTARAVHRR